MKFNPFVSFLWGEQILALIFLPSDMDGFSLLIKTANNDNNNNNDDIMQNLDLSGNLLAMT